VNQASIAARRRSVAALELGRRADAVRFAKVAVAADAGNADSYCVLANAQCVAGAPEEALLAAERACALAPERDWPHAIRAAALRSLGKHTQALDAIDTAIRLRPAFAQRHRVRASILAELGRRKDATEAAARACTLAPNDPLTYDLVGDLAFGAGRYADAENAWRTALRLDPMSALRLNNFGAALDRQGRKDEARETYRRAIGMDPSLEISKRNLHHSVRSSLKVGAIMAGGGAVGGFKIFAIGGVLQGAASAVGADGANTIEIVAIGVVVVLGILVGLRLRIARGARRREAELEARDPELVRLYRQIEADVAAGRLRKNSVDDGASRIDRVERV
jgi:tetratricopeptide (TPR) repeat protein